MLANKRLVEKGRCRGKKMKKTKDRALTHPQGTNDEGTDLDLSLLIGADGERRTSDLKSVMEKMVTASILLLLLLLLFVSLDNSLSKFFQFFFLV